MRYKSLKQCIDDLDRNNHLIRIEQDVDPHLEMAEIHRRVFQANGPAVYYANVKGTPFPAVSNLFGTLDRSRFLFRSTLKWVQRLIEAKADPPAFLRAPWKALGIANVAFNTLPQKVRSGPALKHTTTIDQLPQVQCWPDDGGPFVLLPQVYTEDPDKPGVMNSNLGMYRIQLSGNDYKFNEEIGLHYQIRRDIGIHHSNALKRGEPLRVSIFVGGPPAHTFSAVMPLPEGLSELIFAGALAGRRFRYAHQNNHVISTEADFVITGTVHPGETKLEGPFGDHLGYYSLTHEFPVLHVENVYHRKDAIWPFTVVGRPPQEDTAFGNLIHDITGPMIPVEIPGLKSINAVDAAGVHPLLIAIGSERYVPYGERQPQEILTLANALLGFGACSLAKYLFICAHEDNPNLDTHHIDDYFIHILERVDWRRDLHFQTHTTIDTLDYSGTGFNRGSKVVIAAAGPKRRDLSSNIPTDLSLPSGFKNPNIALPGILAIEGPAFKNPENSPKDITHLAEILASQPLEGLPLILIVSDSTFTARTLNNFLWVTFTRSNPSHDIYGIDSFIDHKHWGCNGSLIIDARHKPHHAPPLIEDPKITKKVDALGASNGPLHGII
ncbi:MAG: UbiD family decarboxylase [Candidatus Latescibacteria bacterium]|jgi:4-hydroxy-3-polyprenylbenzoate decarboxylase|nr:UbiD family decarboxylase [Candidatus Latescibacterota bacterium]